MLRLVSPYALIYRIVSQRSGVPNPGQLPNLSTSAPTIGGMLLVVAPKHDASARKEYRGLVTKSGIGLRTGAIAADGRGAQEHH